MREQHRSAVHLGAKSRTLLAAGEQHQPLALLCRPSEAVVARKRRQRSHVILCKPPSCREFGGLTNEKDRLCLTQSVGISPQRFHRQSPLSAIFERTYFLVENAMKLELLPATAIRTRFK